MSNAVYVAEQQAEHTHQDHMGAKLGMWAFLFTEILMFFGLILLYAVYRYRFPDDFHYATNLLNTTLGTINTIILLTSSMTVAMAIAALERGRRKVAALLTGSSAVIGFFFLVNKYFEWSAKIHHGLYPNSREMLAHTKGENIFYSLYYGMTGLHGLHVFIGVVLLTFMTIWILKKSRKRVPLSRKDMNRLTVMDEMGRVISEEEMDEPIDALELVYTEHSEAMSRKLIWLENVGLFWHLVDIVWIFLFPLFYLIS